MNESEAKPITLTFTQDQAEYFWQQMSRHCDQSSQKDGGWKSDSWENLLARIRVQLLDQGFKP